VGPYSTPPDALAVFKGLTSKERGKGKGRERRKGEGRGGKRGRGKVR